MHKVFLSKGEESRSSRGGRLLACAFLACLVLLVSASSALATFHLVYISEIYPGSAAQPQSGYVELQMYDPDQNLVASHSVTIHNAAGATTGTFTFPADLPGVGVNQQTMLVGDDGVEAAFGVKPDLVGSAFNLSASGGAVCWEGLDCVSWGNFTGVTSPSGGAPAGVIPDGLGLTRFISGGSCSNLLDEADDTNDSDADFANASPSPQSYATVPSPDPCTAPAPTPATTIKSKPPSPTHSTSASFEFDASPAATGFQCRLDKDAYAACDSGTVSYPGPLAEGTHSFRVRGVNANGTGTPAIYGWVVDTTAPKASITSHPADPSPGKSASFRYSSSEGGSKFECRLSPLEGSFTACDTQPQVYSSLANGKYEFEVKATDPAGNQQAVPTVFPWTVNNALEDKTPPETTILSKPADPSASSAASFTYSSSEAGSTFQCKLDGGNFSSCPAAGITYTGLAEGPHTFQVRAVDASNNVDPSPAGYSFQVVLAAAPLAAPTAPAPPGSTKHPRPNTTIAKAVATTHDRTPTFRFASSQAGAKFQCKLDRGPYATCRSPFTTKKLSFGPHLFQVRATVGGTTDSSPAKFAFKVVRG